MDLIDDPREGEKQPRIHRNRAFGAIKRVIEGEFAIAISREVGRVSRPRSGISIWNIKDEQVRFFRRDLERVFGPP